jgi:RimJ/RimL family protein N-acetyltransferase
MGPFIEKEKLPLLRGGFVYLRFLAEADREALRPLARDERIWEYTKTLLIRDDYDLQFNNYFNDALSFEARGDQTFAIVAVEGDIVIGMTRAYDIERRVKRVTIGHTWYVPSVWGKVHNKECKLLLLRYIFEDMEFGRVDFKVAGQNIRSQKAVAKIGGVREGVLRRYSIRNDGVPSDVVYFSILADEWPERKERLEGMVDKFKS